MLESDGVIRTSFHQICSCENLFDFQSWAIFGGFKELFGLRDSVRRQPALLNRSFLRAN